VWLEKNPRETREDERREREGKTAGGALSVDYLSQNPILALVSCVRVAPFYPTLQCVGKSISNGWTLFKRF